MDDLISRQAAIDALHMHLMYRMGTDSNKKRLDEWINNLPSAQTDVPDINDGDMISRRAVQEMIDRIGGMYPYRQIGNRDSYSQYNEAWTDAINRVDAELNSLPSAQPEQHWIPCGERLPEERGFYLTTTKDKAVYCDYWNEDNFDRTEMVIAWMPLPEPYEEEKRNA